MKFSSKIFLAPMQVVSDRAFRLMCHNYGSGMQFTEMINVNAVCRNNKAIINLAKTIDEEKPVAVQLYGNNVEMVKNAVKKIINEHSDIINPDMFDFNFGCSSKLILNQGSGASLLKRPKRMGDIISAIKSVTDLPVNAKIRLGINPKLANYIKTAKILEKEGIDMLTVHARYQNQDFKEKANWNAIKEIKENVSIPVIGNGDVNNEESAKKMLEETKCDYVMIGHAAMGNPFIFKRINHFLKTGKKLKQISQLSLFKKYLILAKKYDIRFKVIKRQAYNFTNYMNSKKLESKIKSAEEIDKLEEAINEI